MYGDSDKDERYGKATEDRHILVAQKYEVED